MMFLTRRPSVVASFVSRRVFQSPTLLSYHRHSFQRNATTEIRSGMEWLQDCVLEVLNELYDPNEIAKGRRLSKKQSDAALPASHAFCRSDAAMTPATRAEFGDYQCNAAMGLATALAALQAPSEEEGGTKTTKKANPRAVAEQIVTALTPKVNDCMELSIAGPGFINLAWRPAYVAQCVHRMASATDDDRLALPKTTRSQRIVVDFSSPNIAKEMHVGHLRSTIIGDTLCNVLEFIGHDVVRLNHVGDWGTQFGMLVEHLRDAHPAVLKNASAVDLGDLVVLYKAAKQRFDADEAFKQRAREGVVKLQSGDPEARAAWEALCAASRVEYQKLYDLLNIRGLEERGESFYNPFLPDVVQDLQALGLAVETDGALAVFLDEYQNRDGTSFPLIVRKSDGGYNYATTDLAAIRHRTTMVDGEKADRVLYVTDAGQSQHFSMVFSVARKAHFVPPETSLEHVPFGLVQGADGKKFATRSGDTVKLKDLLEEAVSLAGRDIQERGLEEHGIDRVARIVGIGAVKYADLSMNRESNYRFQYEKMLSLNGNTAPYMLYAYARICSIVRKASGAADDGAPLVWPAVAPELLIAHPSELELMRNLIQLPDVIAEVERDLYPHRLCEYLFATSQKFNQFYEHCPVKQAETPALQASRLSLCTTTARTIRLLLTLLGIEVVEKL